MRDFYKQLIALRNKYFLGEPSPIEVAVHESEKVLTVLRKSARATLLMVFHFGATVARFHLTRPVGKWRIVFDSSAEVDSSVKVQQSRQAHHVNELLQATSASPHSIALDLPARSFLVFENLSPTE